MHVDTKLQRGDQIRMRPDHDWPNDPPPAVWELLCDPTLAADGQWLLHIRWVTAGTCDNSAVGDEGLMLVRLDKIDHVTRDANPDYSCEGDHD